MIIPDWPAPKRIKAVTTTRSDGNLALLHVGDNAAQVQQNRLRLTENLQLPSPLSSGLIKYMVPLSFRYLCIIGLPRSPVPVMAANPIAFAPSSLLIAYLS
ncbi:hypothetical protein [Coxiella endosymbiont of Ornithodoros maritimus]|uniref:hypothetical protein n=1 Tax=Coxiella endosymbiont of Ornithodoros maritimus TaxID=1656172 RepID=UPI002263F8AC|nr:hypothetical protein [Coxiella endosymbiont of Ornithodoros maritimus]